MNTYLRYTFPFCFATCIFSMFIYYRFIALEYTNTRFYINNHLNDICSKDNLQNEWIVVTSVSYGFRDMFDNWWHFYKKLHLPFCVLVIAEDEISYSQYKQKDGLKVILGDNDTDTIKAVSYNTPDYKKMVSKRASYLLNQINKGYNVIYSDIDTVWLKDPRPYIKGNCQIWASLDGKLYYCTGFIVCKPGSETKQFLAKWMTNLLNNSQLNQPIFNRLINTSNVRHCSLPRIEFPSGNLYFKGTNLSMPHKFRSKSVVIVHNNYIIGHDKKVLRFKKAGLWSQGNQTK